MEKNMTFNLEITEYSSEEEETYEEKVKTEHVEMNEFESKSNEYLLVGIYGHGSGYLKVALYDELKANSKSFKVKFLTGNIKEKNKPKKTIAELHQIKTGDQFNLVLYTKADICQQNYKHIAEYLETNLTFKQTAVFDSFHLSKTFLPEETKDTLFSLKNRKQLSSNQFIKAHTLPAPNGVQGFAAYLITYLEVKDLPCVIYIAITSLHEVCLNSIRLYEQSTGVTYSFLKDKLNDEKVRSIKATLLLKEYNSFKNSFYT